MIRLLIADDSAFMRHAIAKHVGSDPGIEVIATARDGQDAVEKILELKPDVVTMDVEMPRMSGIEALERVMQESPTAVVMLSALTTAGSETTIRALELGAVDFVAKPSGSISLDIHTVAEMIIGKVKAAAQIDPRRLRFRPPASQGPARPIAIGETTGRAFAPGFAPSRPTIEPRPSPALGSLHSVPRDQTADLRVSASADGASNKRPEFSIVRSRVGSLPRHIVAIGSSTGGPQALCQVVPRLPLGLDAAVVVVQHMPPMFTKSLALRLDQISPLSVKEAEEGDRLETGQVLVAPGDFHMMIDREGKISLQQGPKMHGVRPAVDITWQALAHHFGNRVVSIILTGMGSDGAEGAVAIRAAGGKVVAQNEATCVVYGMPRAVVERGAADKVVPLDDAADAALALLG